MSVGRQIVFLNYTPEERTLLAADRSQRTRQWIVGILVTIGYCAINYLLISGVFGKNLKLILSVLGGATVLWWVLLFLNFAGRGQHKRAAENSAQQRFTSRSGVQWKSRTYDDEVAFERGGPEPMEMTADKSGWTFRYTGPSRPPRLTGAALVEDLQEMNKLLAERKIIMPPVR